MRTSISFMQAWRQWPIKSMALTDADYPKELKRISKPPPVLYYRGEWDCNLFKRTTAIVGSRKVSRYGKQVIENLVTRLVADQTTILSGFMYGADTEAHKQTIYYGGKTIAVLGNGIDYLYPTENDDLYCQILDTGGLVMSEYDPDFGPTLWSFPQRNRIVSGLCTNGVIVVEAGMKSGSLITARFAYQQGKKVWAVPGMMTSPLSEGTNWLIHEKRAEILSDYELLGKAIHTEVQQELFDLRSPEEQQLIDLLKREEFSIDELSRLLKMPINKVTITLSQLRLRGAVDESGGRFFVVSGLKR